MARPVKNLKLRTRLVDVLGGQRAYAIACGQTVCNVLPVFEGKLLGATPDGFKVFGITSECHAPRKASDKISYVLKNQFPPFGLPTIIRLVLSVNSFTLCFPTDQCPDTDLIYDGTNWVGSIPLASGTLNLRLVPVVTAGLITSFKLYFDTCMPANTFLEIAISCIYPLAAGGAAPLSALDSACCSDQIQDTLSVTANLTGYTLNRHVAREVGRVSDGKILFAMGDCCTKQACAIENACCGCEAVPREWQFPVSGVTNGTCGAGCAAWNTNWSLIYRANGSAVCTWQVPTAENSGICTPGTPWSLSCDGTNWILASSVFGTGNATYQLSVADWKCFGPNTMTKTSQGGNCLTFPNTVTLVAA